MAKGSNLAFVVPCFTFEKRVSFWFRWKGMDGGFRLGFNGSGTSKAVAWCKA